MTNQTATNTETKTFLKACIDFFGLKDGQSKMDAGKEFMQLSEKDREEVRQGMEQVTGWKIAA